MLQHQKDKFHHCKEVFHDPTISLVCLCYILEIKPWLYFILTWPYFILLDSTALYQNSTWYTLGTAKRCILISENKTNSWLKTSPLEQLALARHVRQMKKTPVAEDQTQRPGWSSANGTTNDHQATTELRSPSNHWATITTELRSPSNHHPSQNPNTLEVNCAIFVYHRTGFNCENVQLRVFLEFANFWAQPYVQFVQTQLFNLECS